MNVFRFVLVILVFCVSFSTLACQLKLRVQLYPPFAAQNEQGQWYGLDVDYANALSKQLGCQLAFVNAPWGRGLEMLKIGAVDFMVNVSKNSHREKHFYFVGPQRIENIRLLGLKGRIEAIDSWEKLANTDARFMRQIGSYFGERFEELMKKNGGAKGMLVELPSNKIRIKLLEKDRVAGFFTEDMYADYLRSTMAKPELLFKHPLIIHQNPVYFAFSKANFSELRIEQIKQVFEKLSQTADYQQIGIIE